jgi:hypothetical protein
MVGNSDAESRWLLSGVVCLSFWFLMEEFRGMTLLLLVVDVPWYAGFGLVSIKVSVEFNK